jgi:hypothetical protein
MGVEVEVEVEMEVAERQNLDEADAGDWRCEEGE